MSQSGTLTNGSSSVQGIETLTGNSGGAVSPDGAFNINTVGTGSITVVGSPGTNSLTSQLTGLTNHAVLVGAGTATITKVGPASSTGSVLMSNGAASDPSFSTATYPSTTTVNQILYSSSTNTVAGLATVNNGVLTTGATGVPAITSLASNGQLIIGSGSGAPAAATLTAGTGITVTNGANSITIAATGGGGGGISDITFDSGSVNQSSLTFKASESGATIVFDAPDTSTMNLKIIDTNNNILLGSGIVGTTANFATAVGVGALAALDDLDAGYTVAVGGFALGSSVTTSSSVAIGYQSLSLLSTGFANTACGAESLLQALTGNYNIAIGFQAGLNYTSSEASNIIIGNTGTVSESHTIRIGTAGSGSKQQDRCFIAGIDGATVTGATVLVDTNGQLGSIASSLRFKEDVEPINSDNFLNLRPVSFKYKNEERKTIHYGLIAEEVEQVFPSLVLYDQENNPYSVKYHEMAALLLNEVKKLREEVNALKAST